MSKAEKIRTLIVETALSRKQIARIVDTSPRYVNKVVKDLIARACEAKEGAWKFCHWCEEIQKEAEVLLT